jgi:O-antigen/teichoic acid export membrane protein
MNIAGRVIRNTGVVLIGNAANNVLHFIVLIYLARYLGANDFGKYSFVIAYLFFFSVLALLGINKIVVREISKDKTIQERIIGNALSIRLFLSIAAIILSLIIINLLNYPFDTKVLVYLMSLTLLLLSIRATYASVFEARLRMEYSALTNFVEAAVSLTLILSIIFFKGDLIHIMAALVIASLSNLIITCFISRRFVKPKLEFNFVYAKKLLAASIPMGLAIVFWSIYYRIDVLMLSLMKTYAAVGYYSAAYTLIAPLEIIPRAIMMSIFPLMSRYSVSSRDSLEISYEKSFRLMLMIALPIAVIIALFSKEIIFLIYGSEFLPSSSALSILIWSVVFLFMNILFANVIVSVGKEKMTAYTAGTMALVNIVLNFLLIPQYSYVGASIATVFTEVLGAAIYFYYIHANLIKNLFTTTILKLTLLNILLGLILIIFDFIPLVLLIILSLIFYIILLVKFNCITKEEISLLKSAIKC